MPLKSGARIGVFEIVAKLGEGGMGEVYRARDTRLDRDVALKVLPDLFTSDPERLARFEREAKVLASLNHPNIAQVYGFEGTAIAMELVDGHGLDEIIRSNAELRTTNAELCPGLPLDRALAIVRQIATALEAAHDQGIIHRDLKPANVKVREDGAVKVLDFGLAKAFAADAESAASGVSNSPTLTARSTQLGMILGTAAYMAPEQAKGRPVDRRADVWALGVVFFEMLAGRRVFEGDDVSDVLASVLKSEPDWTTLPADLPGPVRRLLKRCLEKDPKRRLRDVAEGMLQLDEGLAAGGTTSSFGTMPPELRSSNSELRTSAKPFWRRALPIVATAAATALAVAGLDRWMTPPAAAPVPARFLHTPPGAAPLFPSVTHRDLAISPDGRTIAYLVGNPGSAQVAIYIRPIGQTDAVPLRGAQPAVGPFFSPDNEWVGFVEQGDQTSIKKVSILGGPSVPVTKAKGQVLGATWTTNGTIVFGTRGGLLYRVGDAGGEPVELTTFEAGETDHVWPSAIPGTSVVLFVAASGNSATMINAQIAAIDLASGRSVRLKVPGSNPRYAPTGHLVYATPDGSLRAMVFDPSTMEVKGNPVPVAEGVGIKPSGAANFDVSADGHLVQTGAGALGAARTITWVDRTGRETAIAAPARNYFYARISPDGSRLSLDSRDEEEDIWIWDLKRETPARLTDTRGADQYGLWMPDHRLVFASAVTGRIELFLHRPDGVGKPEQITDTAADKLIPFPNAITPDGKQIIFRTTRGTPKNDLFVADIATRKVSQLLVTEHDERNAALSPDGGFMVFESDQSGGRTDVFIRPFPKMDTQVKVSTAGGTEPVWSSTTNEVFCLADNKLMAVPVRTSGGIEVGKPVALFDVANYFFGGLGRNYDVTRDGKRFVMVKNAVGEQSRSLPITVVLNWAETLRARAK